jgi:hypothetical protein
MFHLSPSTIARYFFQDCERFLRYRAAPRSERESTGIPERQFDHSPLMRAVLASGVAWEGRVVEKLLNGKVDVAPGNAPLSERRWPEPATLDLLRKAPAGRFLYQPTLKAPAGFYTALGLDPNLFTLGENHPDLIEVRADGGGRLLRVIDVKRGESLQLAYRVQIVLYALELDAVLREAGITDARADLDVGGVWLGDQPAPEEFDLREVRPHVELFLRQELPRILSTPPHDVPWHVQFRCERCDYFDHCRTEMRRNNDLSRLVNLTAQGKKHLISLGVRTLPQLQTFLDRPEADAELARCASLAGERHYLQGRVAAFSAAGPRPHGAAAVLPRHEDVAVFVLLQREPLGRSTYLAGLFVSAKPEVAQALTPSARGQLFDAAGKPQPCVLVAARPDATGELRRQAVRLLYDVLLDVDRHNQGKPWEKQLSLQVYTHTDRDRDQLVEWLMESLREPDLADRAMMLLLHLHGPDLLLTDEHPGSPVPYPVVVLQNALTKMLALPVEVSYTLPEVLERLGSGFRYQRKDHLHYPLGHGLRSEAVHSAWHQGRADLLDTLRQEGRLYLFALRALLGCLRQQVRDELFAWPPKFQLPPLADIDDPLLSRLAFFTRYESLLRCRALREGRQEPRAVQAQLGHMLELVAVSDNEFEAVGEPLMDVEEGTFPSWLLVRDSDDGRRAQLEFKDYDGRSRRYCKQSPHLALVSLERVTPDQTTGFPRRLRVAYATAFQGAAPQRGERFQLHPRFMDYTTDPVVRFLEELDDEGGGLFLRLLRDPELAAGPHPLPTEVQAAAAQAEPLLSLTGSQQAAYRAIRGRKAVAAWGPPGTGKTHFLATVILGLADAHARAGRPFRVLVTAFTHAAIQNLLRKIDQRRAEITGLTTAPALAKAKGWEGEAAFSGEVVAEDGLADWLARNRHAVVGATVYACLKARKKTGLEGFDLVVVDEASQVRVPEASVPVHLVAAAGRLVLAGDDLQLPPIVQGVYPEAPEGEPVLHRSSFEAVRSRARGGSPVVQMLTENHRMNDVLTSFAASLLYGPDYTCYDDHVSRRRLRFEPARPPEDPLLAACLEPQHPLVVVILEGVQAAGTNPVEAALVARLVTALRDGLRDENGRAYADDAAFFKDGLFVVSPHRAQNRAIRRELDRLRAWTSRPFVDTVDKMQGQEADAAVISYGVSDPEYALREAEFIYNVNRLNVAITRARTKSIVCLPAPLLDASPQVLEVPEASRGLSFMRRLVQAVEAQGDARVYEVADGVRARVLRASRLAPPGPVSGPGGVRSIRNSVTS